MPSIPFVDKGEEVYVGRDTTVKGDLAEVLFSVCIFVFSLSVTLNQKEVVAFLFLSLPSHSVMYE